MAGLIGTQLFLQKQVHGVRGAANVLGYHRAEGELVRRCKGTVRSRLTILDVEAQVGELFSRLRKLEHVLGYDLREQRRLSAGIIVEAELDFTMPPRCQASA